MIPGETTNGVMLVPQGGQMQSGPLLELVIPTEASEVEGPAFRAPRNKADEVITRRKGPKYF